MSTTVDKQPRYWCGPAPEECDICHTSLTTTFIDGATTYGPWGCMCVSCHAMDGRGLGTGHGQKYERQPDGRWLKVAG